MNGLGYLQRSIGQEITTGEQNNQTTHFCIQKKRSNKVKSSQSRARRLSRWRRSGHVDNVRGLQPAESAIWYRPKWGLCVLCELQIGTVLDCGFKQWEELCADIWITSFRHVWTKVQAVKYYGKLIFHSYILWESPRLLWKGNQ